MPSLNPVRDTSLPRPVSRSNPNSDYHRWKALLKAAGVRGARLHDARHTAATVLLVIGVPERTVMGIMGWSSTSMAARYQVSVEIALRVGQMRSTSAAATAQASGASSSADQRNVSSCCSARATLIRVAG